MSTESKDKALRVALAQINTTVGDVRGNAEKTLEYAKLATEAGADLVVFPEMTLPGYPPEDLLLKRHFIAICEEAFKDLAQELGKLPLTTILGNVIMRESKLYNALHVISPDSSPTPVTYYKMLLPNYGVFDEKRYFTPGSKPVNVEVNASAGGSARGSFTVCLTICEDIWERNSPAFHDANAADLIVNISASPYHRHKGKMREQLIVERAQRHSAYVALCALVGGQDELVFDGQSLAVDRNGALIARGQQFAEDLVLFEVPSSATLAEAEAGDGPRNYILYYSEVGPAPDGDAKKIEQDPYIDVVQDENELLLVKANRVDIDRILSKLPGWSVSTGSAIEFPVESGITRAMREAERTDSGTAGGDHEAWLQDNEPARKMIERGLEQARNGELSDGPQVPDAIMVPQIPNEIPAPDPEDSAFDVLVDSPYEGSRGGHLSSSVDTRHDYGGGHSGTGPGVGSYHRVASALEPIEEVYNALKLGLRDYTLKNGFEHVVLGLSGGLDSAITACVAADALGPENVTCVVMPSVYSSDETQSDARSIAAALGTKCHEIPIKPGMEAYETMLQEQFAEAAANGIGPGIAEENIQARTRGNIVMALSNKFGWMVLTTGNKSEMAVGYATLYGDMSGGYSVLKDVPKTLAYELAEWRNSPEFRGNSGKQPETPPIPIEVITRPPSAELAPGQRDEDSLPPYEVLDPILEAYIEEDKGRGEIAAQGYDAAVVGRVIAMVDRAEYKRRQAAPGVRITPKAFGRDRRLPITNRFND